MSDLSKKLTEFYTKNIENYKKILTVITYFITKVERAIISHNPQQYKDIKYNLDKCNIILNNTSLLDDPLELTLYIYDNFYALDNYISSLFKLFHSKDLVDYRNAGISFNSILREETERANIQQYFIDLKKAIIDNDIIIFNYFQDVPVQFIINHKQINRFTIYLISKILKQKSQANKEILYGIIENQKDTILSATRIQSQEWQIMLLKYNLIPINPFTNLSQDIIDGILKSKHINLLIIYKEGNHPISFNLNGLISEKYITQNKLIVNERAGLTETFIKKNTTISELDCATKGLSEQHFGSHSIIHEINPKFKWLVMEIMCNQYRFLTKINTLINNKMSHLFDNALNYNDIKGLFEGISTRPHHYNSAYYDTNWFNPNAKFIIQEFNNREEIIQSTSPIKDKLKELILAEIKTIKINKINDFRTLSIPDIKIQSIFQKVIFSTNKSAEHNITYYIKLYSLTNDFIKRFRKEIYLTKINENIFKEVNDVKEYFNTIFYDMISNILEAMDTLKMFINITDSLKLYYNSSY